MAFETENSKSADLLPEGLLTHAQRAHLIASANPALIMAEDGRSPLWASPDAARRFGYEDAATMMRARLRGSAPGTRRLVALAADDENTGMRLERLRFFSGFHEIVHTVLCQRFHLADGRRAMLITFPAGAPDAPMPEPLDAGATLPASLPASGQETSAQETPGPDDLTPDWLDLPSVERKARRFVFSLDAAGRIGRVSPPLALSVGSRSARIEGLGLDAVVGGFDAEAGQRIGSAISRGETWSGISVEWPVDGTTLHVPVELAALPTHDADRMLTGFSGFGRCRIDAVGIPEAVESETLDAETLEPEVAEPAMPETGEMAGYSEHAVDTGVIASADGDNDNVDVDATEPRLLSADEDTPALMAEDTEHAAEDSAEHLHENKDTSFDEPTPEAAAPQPVISENPSPWNSPTEELNVVSIKTGQPTIALAGFQRNGLSSSERNAFREIAKALGARFEEEEADAPLPLSAAPRAANSPLPAAGPLPAQHDEASVPASHDEDTSGAPPDAGLPLIDRLPIGVLVLKGDVPLFANRTLLDLTGYADFGTFVTEGGARAIFRKGALPRVDKSGFDTVVLTTREGEMVPVDAHMQLVDWDGGRATLLSIRRAIELEQGKALRTVALDLKRAQERAGELRAILDTATDGVITLDENGHVLSMNGAAEALFGIAQNEIVGEHLTRLLHNDSHAGALDYIDGLKAHGVRSVLNDGRDVFGREKKGGRIPLFMTLGRINDDDPQRYCAVLRDMTAWKRAEAELTDARRMAELASAKKSDFLTKISHEIRTPMNAIIGFAEVMQDERLGPLGNLKYKEYLGDIRTSGLHVVSLVNDLLDLAKIEAGRMEMSFAATDLNAIVASCVGIIQPQATAARVLVRTQLAQPMPQVVADERSIRQIVLNMLSNATRFTESGGQVLVSTSLVESGEAVIRIRDTGVGMSQGEIEQALEPFRQVGTQRNKGGTGLGLPLTRALVQANRANFAIRSAPGEGTLVEITFPSTRVLAE